MEQKKKIKIIIIVLAVLLGLSLVALGGTLLYHKLSENKPATVTVPDNLITPDEDTTGQNSKTDKNETTEQTDNQTSPSESASPSSADNTTTATASTNSTTPKKAVTLALYDKQSEDNTPFKATNMFPGDSEAKYFRVQVSYKSTVTVHYHADIRPGYEKLAEVLKTKITLLTTGETLYDGLMRDMPKSLTYKLSSAAETTDELYYEINCYLDTSVGNEYQNKDLIADFNWWVEETGNLGPSSQTGDNTNILLWAALAAASGSVLILLLFVRRRKEDEENG